MVDAQPPNTVELLKEHHSLCNRERGSQNPSRILLCRGLLAEEGFLETLW